MQLASAIAALLLVVPLLVLRLAGRRVDSRAYLATAMPFSLVTLGLGGVLTVAVRRLAGIPLALELFAVLAVIGSAVMLVRGAAQRAALLRFISAVNGLSSPVGRKLRIPVILGYLKKVPAGEERPPSPHVMRVLFAASALCQVGAYREAELLLARLPRSWLTEAQLGPYANALTIARLNLGDVEGAREALAEAPEDTVEGRMRAHLTGLRALCASLSGEPDEALALLRDEPGVGAADLALLHTTRAHAHAALGDEDQAEAELSTLADELGSDVLSFAIDIEGPASPIAETVRASFDAGSNAPADEPDDAPADEPDDAPADEPDDERAAD